MTDTTERTEDEHAPPPVRGEARAPLGWLDTSDHKRIGRLFIVVSLLALGAGLVADMLVRFDLSDAEDFVVLDGDTFGQTFVVSRDLIVFGGLIPLFLGLAVYVVPLQVGAGSLAFPRAALLAFWGWFLSGALLVTAYLVNGGAYGGDADGVSLYLLALAGVILSLLLGAVCVAATVLTLRSPNLFVDETPPFSWASMVTAVMLLLTLPVALGQIALLYIDQRYGPLFLGGNFGIYAQLEWVYRSPQLYVYAVPILGVIGEIVPVWGRGRQVKPGVVAGAIGAFGIFGFGAFTQYVNEPELLDDYEGVVNVAAHVGALLAVLVLLGAWGATIARSSELPSLDAALLSSLAAGFLLLIATIQGAAGALIDWTDAFDRAVPLRFTTFTTGLLSLVIGTVLLAASAALLYWTPKIWGRRMLESLGLLSLLVVFVGALVAWVGPTVAGVFQDQPDLVVDDPNLTSTFAMVVDDVGNAEGFSALGGVGVAVMLAGLGLVGLNLAVSVLARRDQVDPDPWGAQTPEWRLPSPPPPGPLAELADLDGGTPLLPATDDSELVEADSPAELTEGSSV